MVASRLAYPILCALAGALLLYALQPAAPESPYADPIVVTKRDIVRSEPDTVTRWRTRVVTVTVPPIVREIAPDAALPDVDAFCGAAGWAPVAADSTTPLPPAQLLVRSVSTEPGWFFAKDRVTAIGPRSDGALARSEYEVRPGWSMRANGDSLIVRSPRFGLLREGVEAGAWTLLGYLIGRL